MRGTEIVSLLGGLALFLYGMQMMSNGLETSVGNQMKHFYADFSVRKGSDPHVADGKRKRGRCL